MDYWNLLVCDLYQSECNVENPATAAAMGLQVKLTVITYFGVILYQYDWDPCKILFYLVSMKVIFLIPGANGCWFVPAQAIVCVAYVQIETSYD
jgi:hypothetical protein